MSSDRSDDGPGSSESRRIKESARARRALNAAICRKLDIYLSGIEAEERETAEVRRQRYREMRRLEEAKDPTFSGSNQSTDHQEVGEGVNDNENEPQNGIMVNGEVLPVNHEPSPPPQPCPVVSKEKEMLLSEVATENKEEERKEFVEPAENESERCNGVGDGDGADSEEEDD